MSTAPASRPLLTPDDLLEVPEYHRFELVDGALVERNVSVLSDMLATEINRRVGTFVREHRLGHPVGAQTGLQIFPWRPRLVRFGDGGVVLAGRRIADARGHLQIPPDLVIEVLSAHDLASEVEEKVVEYQRAGVRLVWVVFPEQQRVHVYRADGTVSVAGRDGQLAGEDVLPGLVIPLADVFDSVAGLLPQPYEEDNEE